ncbi:MAG: hypothetical protein V9H26_17855 [Verrucomicrobiota bacterium]
MVRFGLHLARRSSGFWVEIQKYFGPTKRFRQTAIGWQAFLKNWPAARVSVEIADGFQDTASRRYEFRPIKITYPGAKSFLLCRSRRRSRLGRRSFSRRLHPDFVVFSNDGPLGGMVAEAKPSAGNYNRTLAGLELARGCLPRTRAQPYFGIPLSHVAARFVKTGAPHFRSSLSASVPGFASANTSFLRLPVCSWQWRRR